MTDNDKMMMAGMIAGRVKSDKKKRLEAAKRLMHWTLDEWSSAVRRALAAKVSIPIRSGWASRRGGDRPHAPPQNCVQKSEGRGLIDGKNENLTTNCRATCARSSTSRFAISSRVAFSMATAVGCGTFGKASGTAASSIARSGR